MSLPGAGETDTKFINFVDFNRIPIDQQEPVESTTPTTTNATPVVDAKEKEVDNEEEQPPPRPPLPVHLDYNELEDYLRTCIDDIIKIGESVVNNTSVETKLPIDQSDDVVCEGATQYTDAIANLVTSNDIHTPQQRLINSDDDDLVECVPNKIVGVGKQQQNNGQNDDDDDDNDQNTVNKTIIVEKNDENVCGTDSENNNFKIGSGLNSVPEVINFELQTVIDDETDLANQLRNKSIDSDVPGNQLSEKCADYVNANANDELNEPKNAVKQDQSIEKQCSIVELLEENLRASLAVNSDGGDDKCQRKALIIEEKSLEEELAQLINADRKAVKSLTETQIQDLYKLPDIQDIYKQVESCYRASSASPPPVPLVTYRWEDVKRAKQKVRTKYYVKLLINILLIFCRFLMDTNAVQYNAVYEYSFVLLYA